MSDDIYAAPESELLQESNGNLILASRRRRFLASIIDSITIVIFTIPIMYFTGGFADISRGEQLSIGYSLLIGALGIIVFIIINGKFLAKDGQTLGKKALGIKIVDFSGNHATIKKHLLPRYFIFFCPSQIPLVGQLFAVINVLFILGKQKRCGHDHIAGTKVVLA